ncbi:hypothetical protein O3M35_009526 [Rhynocoris fuscipes]|uniref:ZBR-type domain-containing protein n=1 Tax=Rhynocoris fuscipes TaxID=488301 RepID=A0AAW1D5Y8_9HEMI
MSTLRNKDAYGSPMDDVLVWATPRNTQKDDEPACKRKCDDSGYASCSSITKSISKILVNTPEVCNSGFNDDERVYTPYVKQSPQGVKKRIFTKIEEPSTYNCTLPVVDSYSEFLIDASLYTEPIEISDKDSTLSMINEEPNSSLGVTEISKQINVNLEIDPCSTPLKNKTTPKKKSRTPIKKKGMRHRSLYGFENVDILFQLGERKNYSLIVSKILSYLSDSDLSSVTMVSHTWRNICLRDTRARSRWFKYIETLKDRKENLNLVAKKLKRSHTPLGNNNMNHSTPLQVRQPKSPPVSPSKFRFHLFQKEAKTLKDDEVLMECPRCSRPSACSPSTLIGECRSIACMLKFCTVCRTPAHDRSPCPYLTPVTPTKKKHTTIGSKESKRFLRRL